jgi:ABC-type multidrug transport system fused ATPase/permease subunit
MANSGKENGRLWLESWYYRVGQQNLLNWYTILSISAGVGLLLVFRAYSHYLEYPKWEGNNIIVAISMSLILILLFLGIPYFMKRSRYAFMFAESREPGVAKNEVATRLESRFHQKKDRHIIIALVILPFLLLNILAILQKGTIFYSDKGTYAALLLDVINYGSGYLILYLFALLLWIVYVISETLREIREIPMRNALPVEINAVDNVGGLGALQEFVLDFLTYYFVIVALLILSYLPPGAMWSYEMLFVVIVFLIGVFVFIPSLGTIRKIVRGKIRETDGTMNQCIKVQQDRIQKLSSDSMTNEAVDEVSNIKTLLEIYHDEHSHLEELYNKNHALDFRTIGQSVASLLIPVLAFIAEVTSMVTDLQGLLPPP